MEIYADVIFFVNFIFSYVLLYILGDYILYRNADVDFVCAEMRGDVFDDNNSLF